jgi:Cu-Zn family superoxide dismutase
MGRATALLLSVPVAVTAGCAGPAGSAAPTESPRVMSAAGTFAPYSPGATAITYDPAVVPPGGRAAVTITSTGKGTSVRLTVAGLRPHRGYGVHLHTRPCGPKGDDAGPHYQHRTDPSASASRPSSDPSYANPQNEVWLDLTTDASGDGSAVSTHPWTFGPTAPRSLIIHAMPTSMPTSMASGEAGSAGVRAACLTLPV